MVAILALGAFGSLIGSFLNVVIYRVPRGRSIVSPPSACGSCEHPIRWYDNIPMVSWIVLRGRCRDCSARISVRYPLIEFAGGLFFAAIAASFAPAIVLASRPADVAAAVIALTAYLYLGAISIALAAIDLDLKRLPNAIVLPAYPVGVVLLAAASLLRGDPASIVTAAIGGLSMGGVYLLIAIVSRGMGMGDVKLAGVLGLFLGWLGVEALAVGWIAGFLIGGLVGVGLLLARRASRGTAVPFGPSMLAGAWLGIFAGPALAAGYMALFGVVI